MAPHPVSKPGRYRRKTQTIEAMQFDPDDPDAVAGWCGGRIDTLAGKTVITLNGSIHPAQPGDYIIRTDIPEDGSRYFPMPKGMFEHSYEEA
jgi:hypothetical protein